MIAAGHSPSDVWEYTPRQLAGFCELRYRRRMAEHLEGFEVMHVAAQGDSRGSKALKRKLREECE